MSRPADDLCQWIALESSAPSPCPYLAGRESQLAFGVALPSEVQLDGLLERGYRRLGYVFYLPRCPGGCQECQPLRVCLPQFAPSRSQRRVLRRVGPHYEVRQMPPHFDEAHFALYQTHARWVAEDNTICSADGYRSAFVDSAITTHLFEFRIDRQLVGVSILDEGREAVSSAYAFWDPAHARSSPGTFSALWEIEWARQRGKSYYYLGYWVRDCRRMRYKSRFRPHQLYDWHAQKWRDGAAT
jgi:arginyl-tRNA--protein-N-Asp/Glu arginylyltransferase